MLSTFDSSVLVKWVDMISTNWATKLLLQSFQLALENKRIKLSLWELSSNQGGE